MAGEGVRGGGGPTVSPLGRAGRELTGSEHRHHAQSDSGSPQDPHGLLGGHLSAGSWGLRTPVRERVVRRVLESRAAWGAEHSGLPGGVAFLVATAQPPELGRRSVLGSGN